MISASSNGGDNSLADPMSGVHSRALTNSREESYSLHQEKRIIDLLGHRRKLTTVPLALGSLVI